jgi:DNA-directed RNA polymerase II subunit RPB9
MATPQSTTSYEGAEADKKLEQITFRFCSECSNMLYPKEDQDAHKLQFTCRTCQYTEDAKSTCVFRNVLNTSAGETAGVIHLFSAMVVAESFTAPLAASPIAIWLPL